MNTLVIIFYTICVRRVTKTEKKIWPKRNCPIPKRNMIFFNITALTLERHLAYCDLNIGCYTLLSHFREKCQFQSDMIAEFLVQVHILQLPVNSPMFSIIYPGKFSMVFSVVFQASTGKKLRDKNTENFKGSGNLMLYIQLWLRFK